MIAQHLTSAFVSAALVAAGLAGPGLEDEGSADRVPDSPANIVASAVSAEVTGREEAGDDAPAVRAVRVTAEGSSTVISIAAGEDATVEDFLLSDPTRLVVDVEQARHALSRTNYSVGRRGIVRLRTSQCRDGVVRLVFELTRRPQYRLDRSGGEVRIRFRNPAGSFSAWSTGGGASTQVAGDVPDPSAQVASASGEGVAIPGPGGDAAEAAESVDGISVTGSDPAPRRQQQRIPRITVTYDEATVQDVLAGFSEFAGVSMVPSPEAAQQTVRGITIENKPWDEALDAILASQGLGWDRLQSGIIVVDELGALRSRDTLQTETRVFRINYAGADSVAEALRNIATPDRGQVVSYGGTNSVIVTDTPPAVARMDSLVNVLDQQTTQVAIEAKIIFVDRTRTNQLGITYDLKDQAPTSGFNRPVPVGGVDPPDSYFGDEQPDGGDGDGGQQGGQQQQQQLAPFAVDLGGSSLAAAANANDQVESPALQILANTIIGGFSLTTFLDALESHQLSDVQATPSIKVVDNQEARIQVGQRTPIRVLEPSAQLQQAQVNVQFEETGIILETTPHVTNNNQVLLDLHAERSGITEAPSDLGFAFDTQEGDTRLLLDNGETGVIGGLTLSDVSRSETGIPILMDLPLLGNLFRTTSETEVQQDLIILVTPRIVGTSPEATTETAPSPMQ